MRNEDEARSRIEQLYAHFNARDIDAVLDQLTHNVVWANGMNGGYVHGREAVREYWSCQFELVQSTVQPIRDRDRPRRRRSRRHPPDRPERRV